MKFLRPLLRSQDYSSIWSDQEISPGDRWDDEIKQGLERAHVGLLLITQSFLNSEYISDVEVPRLVAKAQEEGLQLLCLYVSPSNVEAVRYSIGGQQVCLTEYQGLNAPNNPLSRMSEPKQDDVLSRVSVEIVDCLKKVSGNLISAS
jgi:hypothetical protein